MERDRQTLEKLKLPDRFVLGDGRDHDPDMRNQNMRGVVVARRKGPPHSSFLRALGEFFTPDTLALIDAAASREALVDDSTSDAAERARVKSKLAELPASAVNSNRVLLANLALALPASSTREQFRLAFRLALLIQKRRREGDAACVATELWPEIVARTVRCNQSSHWACLLTTCNGLNLASGSTR